MKYSVVEEDRLIKPLYKSSFPFIKRTKWEHDGSSVRIVGSSARIVKQFLFRRTLNLFVDDTDLYRALGGSFGETIVERFRVSDYPSWSQLTGILSYAFPDFCQKTIIQGGCSDCYLIKGIEQENDLITIHSVLLEKTDSLDSMKKVRSVSFEYVKSWGVTIDKESAEREEIKAKNWFISKLHKEGITNIQEAECLIDSLLKAGPNDTGIVRKSKAYDFRKLISLAQKQFKSDIQNDYGFYKQRYIVHKLIKNDITGERFLLEDTSYIWIAAKHLYSLHGDYSLYDVYDDALVKELVSSLAKLTREAVYLLNGIYDHSVDVAWAKEKIKELKSELNEVSFPFERRGDTGQQWKRFNEIYNRINQLYDRINRT